MLTTVIVIAVVVTTVGVAVNQWPRRWRARYMEQHPSFWKSGQGY